MMGLIINNLINHGKRNYRYDAKRFSKIPSDQEFDCQKELSNLDAIFSVQSIRQVKNDFTIQFKYQLSKEQPATVRRQEKVLIEERLDGSLAIRLRGKYLNFKLLPAKPQKAAEPLPAAIAASKAHTPTPNHPWRGKFAKEEEHEKVFS